MNKKNQDFKERRSILTGMGVAAAGLAVGATTASAQGASTGFKTGAPPAGCLAGQDARRPSGLH